MRERRLKERRLRRDELQLQHEPRHEIQLRGRKRAPHHPARTARTGRRQRPHSNQQHERERIHGVERHHTVGVPEDERHRRPERAEDAAPVFHHEADLRVVERQVDRDEQRAEECVQRDPPDERSALHRQIARQTAVRIVEEPAVDVGEQQAVDEAGDEPQAQQPPEAGAGGAEKAIGAGAAPARVAVEDPAGEKRPHEQVHGDERGNRKHLAVGVERAAQMVERGGEADHGGRQRAAHTGGLPPELLPPIVVEPVRRRVRHETLAQMGLDGAADDERERHGGGDRHREDAGDDQRRAEHPPPPVEPGAERHTKNA